MKLKEGFLKKDLKLCYAVAGFISLDEALKRLDRHGEKFNKILKRLDRHEAEIVNLEKTWLRGLRDVMRFLKSMALK